MGNEAPDRPAAESADDLAGDHTTKTVSAFVMDCRRRDLDPAVLLDAGFLLRGAE
ncbi:hypothetical protein [Nocardia sp. NPDC024068]|uniref:hypothetical protein n=1 Tax=Nocardia sp. NPDC024068 TaxID=3157197 RepID=UPI0033EA710E